uniref:Uncharacterized protein n=1 Tax=Steinernema glaseri TaxID=37863 RepID=A0A1I7ZKU8_9BILA
MPKNVQISEARLSSSCPSRCLRIGHDLANVYVSLICVEEHMQARVAFLVDSNFSLIVLSKNASKEHPYADAFFFPDIVCGVKKVKTFLFHICSFDRLDDYVDAADLFHVEFWFAFRKVFLALEAPRKR